MKISLQVPQFCVFSFVDIAKELCVRNQVLSSRARWRSGKKTHRRGDGWVPCPIGDTPRKTIVKSIAQTNTARVRFVSVRTNKSVAYQTNPWGYLKPTRGFGHGTIFGTAANCFSRPAANFKIYNRSTNSRVTGIYNTEVMSFDTV